jgi:hypothetical protein
VLGVAPGASYEELKQAYTAKAFRLNPDRHAGADAAGLESAEWRMKELNASWAILRDTERRKAYDDELERSRRPRTAAPAATVWVADDLPTPEPADDDDLPVAPLQHGMLRFAPILILAVVLLVILIVSAYAGGTADDDPRVVTTELAPVGSCVRVDTVATAAGEPSEPELVEVSCETASAARVVAKVPFPRPCPAGSSAFPITAESLSVCLQ